MKNYDTVIEAINIQLSTIRERLEKLESKSERFDDIEKRMVKAELRSDKYARLLESYRDLLDRLKKSESQPHCFKCGRVVEEGVLMCECCSLNAPCI